MKNIALSMEGISKRFGKLQALNNFSLELYEGEILGVLGPNGAGKSTVVNILGGLVLPNSGNVKVCGVGLYNDFERCMKMLGVAPDKPCFYGYLSGEENLSIIAALYGKAAKARIPSICEELALEEYIYDKVSTYPNSIVRELAIAAALLCEPRVIALDEAFDGTDPQTIVTMRRMLRRLAVESGTATIVTSHQIGELERVCDKIAIMREGVIEGIGTIGQLKAANTGVVRYRFKTDRLQEARKLIAEQLKLKTQLKEDSLLIDADQAAVPRAAALLTAHSIRIYKIEPVEKTLEEAYYKILKYAKPAESMGFKKSSTGAKGSGGDVW